MTGKLKPTVDLGYPTEPYGRIPAFNDIEEAAEFWDTHDTSEFSDEFRPTLVKVGAEFHERITVRLRSVDRQALVERAREANVEPSALATTWLEDRLRHELEKKAS